MLDLRSSAYGQMWKPKGELAERTVTVRVLQSTVVDGVEKRTVVSHFNKATKGRIVRALLEAGVRPAYAGLRWPRRCAGWGMTVEEAARAKPGKPRPLDVVVAEL